MEAMIEADLHRDAALASSFDETFDLAQRNSGGLFQQNVFACIDRSRRHRSQARVGRRDERDVRAGMLEQRSFRREGLRSQLAGQGLCLFLVGIVDSHRRVGRQLQAPFFPDESRTEDANLHFSFPNKSLSMRRSRKRSRSALHDSGPESLFWSHLALNSRPEIPAHSSETSRAMNSPGISAGVSPTPALALI